MVIPTLLLQLLAVGAAVLLLVSERIFKPSEPTWASAWHAIAHHFGLAVWLQAIVVNILFIVTTWYQANKLLEEVVRTALATMPIVAMVYFLFAVLVAAVTMPTRRDDYDDGPW